MPREVSGSTPSVSWQGGAGQKRGELALGHIPTACTRAQQPPWKAWKVPGEHILGGPHGLRCCAERGNPCALRSALPAPTPVQQGHPWPMHRAWEPGSKAQSRREATCRRLGGICQGEGCPRNAARAGTLREKGPSWVGILWAADPHPRHGKDSVEDECRRKETPHKVALRLNIA